MSATWPIAKREIRSYFNSPIPYIVVTVFMLIAGWMTFSQLFLLRQASMRDFFQLSPWLFALFVPAITMRSLAEEKGSGTIEMLITMPVRDWEVVVAKFIAACTIIASMVAMTGCYLFTVIGLDGDLDSGPTLGGYLGIFLLACAYAAIGLMASSFTKNQIVAFLIGFFLCFVLFLAGMVAPFAPKFLQPLLTFLSTTHHISSIARGVIDLRDIAYFGSIIAICLIVATVSLDARRWR